MISILSLILNAATVYFLWKGYGKLDIISRDVTSREELVETIEKFAALAGDHKKKVVAFRAKKSDDDVE